MQLRDHPLMTYRGVPNWPPAWTLGKSESAPRPVGEVGTLEDVLMTNFLANKIFVLMLFSAQRYMGSLIFDDVAFCTQIFDLLKLNRGKQIKEIGDLDLAYTL
jgi:hypothetical protein